MLGWLSCYSGIFFISVQGFCNDGVVIMSSETGKQPERKAGKQDDIFVLYSTFCSRRSTWNMDNDRIQRLRRREEIAMLKFLYSVAAVATIACLFI